MKETTLYEKLSLIRSWQHLTVEDIAKNTFESLAYIIDFERGEYPAICAEIATERMIARLARAYGLAPAFLAFLVEEEYALRVSAGDSVMSQAILEEAKSLPKQARRFLDHQNFVVLDTETTGKDASSCEMVEIAIVAHDGTVLLNSLVKPSKPIPAEAMVIHGITDEDCQHEPTFPELFPRIVECIKDKTVIVYNAGFDITLLHQLAMRHNLQLTVTAWCLMEAYAEYRKVPGRLGNYKWHRLSDACEYQGVQLEEAHRALGDTLATWKLLKALAGVEEKR